MQLKATAIQHVRKSPCRCLIDHAIHPHYLLPFLLADYSRLPIDFMYVLRCAYMGWDCDDRSTDLDTPRSKMNEICVVVFHSSILADEWVPKDQISRWIELDLFNQACTYTPSRTWIFSSLTGIDDWIQHHAVCLYKRNWLTGIWLKQRSKGREKGQRALQSTRTKKETQYGAFTLFCF